MAHQLFRLIAQLDSHFAADDQLPADGARWREFRRSVIRMKDALDPVQTTLREERERGVALIADTARKLEGYVRFGLGQARSSAVEARVETERRARRVRLFLRVGRAQRRTRARRRAAA